MQKSSNGARGIVAATGRLRLRPIGDAQLFDSGSDPTSSDVLTVGLEIGAVSAIPIVPSSTGEAETDRDGSNISSLASTNAGIALKDPWGKSMSFLADKSAPTASSLLRTHDEQCQISGTSYSLEKPTQHP